MKCLTWKIMTLQEVRFPDGRERLKRERSLAVQRQPFLPNDTSKWEPIIPPNYCWLHSLCHVLVSWKRCWWCGLNGSYGLACFSKLIGRQFGEANRERRKCLSSADCPLSNVFFMSWQAPRGATEAQGCEACEMSSTSYQKSLKLCFNEINKALLKSAVEYYKIYCTYSSQQWTASLE